MIIYNPDDTPFISVDVNDTSYRYRGLMASDELNLEFSLAEHIELPVGAYCTFEAQKYVLMSLSNVTVHHRRNYEYKVTMLGPLSEMENYVIHNMIDHRIKFDLTARPSEHLAQIVANLNERDGEGVWSAGSCIDVPEKNISYNSTTCRDALVAIASTFETEFEIVSHTINIGKVEYHKDTPLSLSYGKGNGLKPGVQRISSSMPVGKIFVQGGDRNISLSEYGSSTLHLPTGATFRFDGTDFVNSEGVVMHTDGNGYSVYLDGAPSNSTELSLDLSNIYPKRIGTVSGLRFEYRKGYYTYAELIAAFPSLTDDDWNEVQVDFYDTTIPSTLDYAECQMTNDEPLTVIFQSGNLVGREFQANFKKEATEDDDARPADRFELIKTDIDGVNMPTRNFLPAVGDTYAVFNVNMPSEYVNNASDKTGAEWDALKEAARVLYDNKDPKVAYRGDLDSIFAKADWINRGDYLKCGSYISFSDPAVQPSPISVRIVGVRQYVNNKEAPTIEFSNDVVRPTASSSIKQLEANEAHVEELSKQGQRYAARSYRNAMETMDMLINAKLKGYTDAISPIAVKTMQLIAGDESLQFKFWQNAACTIPINPVQPFDTEAKTVTISHAYLQHMTLGIDSIMPAQGRQLSDYKVWEMQEHTSAVMSDPDARYYVYAKCEKNDTSAVGHYVFDTQSHEMEETETIGGESVDFYYFLIGVLNSEMDGDRDFASLYGFTEILPGQITTDKIRSSDGYSWFDMTLNQMRFGDANKSFSWNLNNNSQFVISGGTIVQNAGGIDSIITVDRGAYDSNNTYYYGDEVYTSDGSRYVYINSTPSSVAPPNVSYWHLKQEGGSNGYNSAIVYLYRRASSAPSIDWTNDLTYSFTDKALTSTPSNWSQTIPAHGDDPLYVTAATASSRSNTDTIAYTEWATPVMLTEDGLNSATVYLYQRASSQPSKPGSTLTYTFATGVLSGNLGNWQQTIPSGNDACWVTQATAISSGTTDSIGTNEWSAVVKLAENGAKGDTGAKLRGPSTWTVGESYQNGVGTEFQDIVRDPSNGMYYICKVSNTATSSTAPHDDSTTWQPFNQMDYLATKLIYTPDAIIGNLVVDKLLTKKTVSGTEINPIRIQDETIAITDDSGNLAVKVTSGNLPTSIPSGGNVDVTSRSTTISAPDGYAVIDTTLGSSSSNRIATLNITSENNRVSIPAMTISASATNGGSYQLYWEIYIGDTFIAEGSGAGSIPARVVTLPTGNNQYLTVRLSGAVFHLSGSSTTLTVSFGVTTSGSQINVSYSSSGTIIASNGAQFNYGYGGFKTSANGAQVIIGGSDYNMAGLGALNGLTVPKKIVFCTAYPSTEESDTFYIKVSTS